MADSIRNTSGEDAPPVPPTKPGGQPYAYEMIYAGGARRAYADTAVELVDALIPGYAEQTNPREQAQARIRLALDTQVRLQAELATSAQLQDCSEDERAVILGSRDVPPSPSNWTAPVPLVLVTVFYRPTGRLARPDGPEDRQIWLDPADEWQLLLSLHNAGVIQLGMRGPAPARPTQQVS